MLPAGESGRDAAPAERRARGWPGERRGPAGGVTAGGGVGGRCSRCRSRRGRSSRGRSSRSRRRGWRGGSRGAALGRSRRCCGRSRGLAGRRRGDRRDGARHRRVAARFGRGCRWRGLGPGGGRGLRRGDRRARSGIGRAQPLDGRRLSGGRGRPLAALGALPCGTFARGTLGAGGPVRPRLAGLAWGARPLGPLGRVLGGGGGLRSLEGDRHGRSRPARASAPARPYRSGARIWRGSVCRFSRPASVFVSLGGISALGH